jgi:hypothetical protein
MDAQANDEICQDPKGYHSAHNLRSQIIGTHAGGKDGMLMMNEFQVQSLTAL